MWTRLWNRCRFLFRRSHFDLELREEMDFHREMLAADKTRAGLTPEEALLAARRQLGNALVAQEEARLPWTAVSVRVSRALATDLREALRGLRAGRATTVLALLILTLGIAAGTVTFSVVDTLALRRLPYHDPARLTAVARVSGRDTGYASLAPQDYFALARGVSAFDGIAAAGYSSLPGETADSPPIVGARTTTNFFDVLGVQPLLGRGFAPGQDVTGNDAIIVLSYQFWTRNLSGDPRVLGRQLRFGKETRQVVGVMPDDFAYWLRQGKAAEFWVPYVPRPEDRSEASAGRSYVLQVFGRRRPGVSLEQAQLQVETVAAQMRKPSFEQDSQFTTLPLQDLVIGPAKSWLLLMLAAVGLVLLASCVNVANLLLARATTRRRELATREALGASRSRLARTLLLEGLMLALAAATAGIAVSYWGVATAKSLLPEGLARVRDITVDGRVLLASVSAAGLCGLIFGAAPALLAARRDLATTIKDDGGNVVGSRGRGRWLGAFLIAEVAFVATLLVGTGLVVATLVHILTMDLGFDRRNVVTFPVSKPLSGIPREQRAAAAEAFLNDVIARAAALPGVVAAGVVRNGVPMSGSYARYSLKLPGGVETGDDFTFHPVSPGYFRAMGVRLVRGRVFAQSDQFGAPSVAVINDVAARQFFASSDPVGQVVTFDGPTTIVGVVGGGHVRGPEQPVQPELYVPLSQRLHAEGGAYGDLVVRTNTVTPDLPARIAAAIAPALNGRKAAEPISVDAIFEKGTAQRRFTAGVLSVFGLVAAVIAAIGIYGVITFLVTQQTREIGLRMALGASSQSVLITVLGRAGRYVAIGVVLGLAGARAISRLFASLVFGITATDIRVYIAVALVLLTLGVAAALAPARRAARLDLLAALRSE